MGCGAGECGQSELRMGLGPESNPEVHLVGAIKWLQSIWSSFLQPSAGSLEEKVEIIPMVVINK